MKLESLQRPFDYILGLPLIFSGITHLMNLYEFGSSIAAYAIIPNRTIWFIAPFLSSLMSVCGLSLVGGVNLKAARLMALGMFLCFSFAQIFAFAVGAKHSCGCFGYSDEPVSLLTITIPVSLSLIAVAANLFGKYTPSPLDSGLTKAQNAV